MSHVYDAIFYSLVIFILLVSLTRVIGKKLLSEMNYFDYVMGITIGTIGGSFVTQEVHGYYVLISPIVFTIAVMITEYISLKSVPFRKLLQGEPLILIQNGKVFEKNLKKIRYNLDDLLMHLREKDVFDLSEVEFAILEPHGKLSVLKKSQYMPVTPGDLDISTHYKGVSSEIIRDGQIVEQNIIQNNLTHEWLYNELYSRNIRNIREIFLATLSTDGNLYVDIRNDNPQYIQEVEDDASVI